MQALVDYNCEDAEDVDGDIETEDKELHCRCKGARVMEYLIQEHVTGVNVQIMIAVEVKKSSVDPNEPVLIGLVKDGLIEVPQLGYIVTKEKVKIVFFKLAVIMDMINLGNMD